MKEYKCDTCGEVFNYSDEVVFDGDDSKEVSERSPDWHSCRCNECYYSKLESDAIAAATRKLEGLEVTHEPTWEQKQYLAADKQTAEHLWNTEQYKEVCVHIGGMYGLSKEEASVEPADGWKAHAERCMKGLGV